MTKKTQSLAVVAMFLLGISAWARAQATPEWRYVVKSGDNPWSITERLLDGMKYWPLVQKHNGIVDPRNIPPGTELRIPFPGCAPNQDSPWCRPPPSRVA